MTTLDTELVGAIVALFGLLVTGGRWMFNRMATELTECKQKLAARDQAAVDALEAQRQKEHEELMAMRANLTPAVKKESG